MDKDTPKVDRPQEKLVKYGTKIIDADLAIILRTGTQETNVLELSKDFSNSKMIKNITIDK